MLSRWTKIEEDHEDTLKSLLILVILESYNLVGNDARIIKEVKLATFEDGMLEQILAFS